MTNLTTSCACCGEPIELSIEDAWIASTSPDVDWTCEPCCIEMDAEEAQDDAEFALFAQLHPTAQVVYGHAKCLVS